MKSNQIDYPTTGGWGQTDGQWKASKTDYERLLGKQEKQNGIVHNLEVKQEACRRFLDAIREYIRVFEATMKSFERDGLTETAHYTQRKLERISVSLADARNELKRVNSDVYNFKQRR